MTFLNIKKYVESKGLKAAGSISIYKANRMFVEEYIYVSESRFQNATKVMIVKAALYNPFRKIT